MLRIAFYLRRKICERLPSLSPFSVSGYLPLIRKDYSTHMHGLAVYVKEELHFARDLSLENSTDSYLSFRLALLHSVSYFFFLCRSPFLALCTVFDSMGFSRSTHLLMFLSLETLTSIIRTGLPILVELIDLVNPVIIFLSQMINLPTQIPDCDCHSPALLNLFISSDASICSKMAFRPLGNSDRSCCCLGFH